MTEARRLVHGGLRTLPCTFLLLGHSCLAKQANPRRFRSPYTDRADPNGPGSVCCRMRIRHRDLRAGLLLGLLSSFAVGCHTGSALPPQSLDSPGGKLFNGYAKEDVKCYSCHNGDGRGANGPNLGERVPKLSDSEILSAINEGPSYMPSYNEDLSEAEKRDLIAWLRQRFGAQKP